jgi:ABC-type microcin C transport system duplicated ATPase subunit YejF
MRLYMLTFTLALLAGCSGKQEKTEAADQKTDNQILYDRVMDVHDEVMPRMNDLEKIKRQLQETLQNGKDLTEEKRKELERKIALLDSASRSMMNWMYEFRPDDLQGDSLKAYLENEMVRINHVKELILGTLKEFQTQPDKP